MTEMGLKFFIIQQTDYKTFPILTIIDIWTSIVVRKAWINEKNINISLF